MRKPRVYVPTDQLDQIASDYLAGTHTTVLARRYGVTQPTIVYHLQKRGIPRRSRSETNRMRAPVDEEELVRLVDAGELSQAQIAVRLCVSLPTIQRTLRRLGKKSKRGRGSPLAKNYFWRGGVRREKEGYVLVKAPNHPYRTKCGYVREHRLVMEEKLGRYLLPSEVVHHRDGNPRNNHPDNLEVFASNADHLRHEWLENWAEIRRSLADRRRAGHRPESPSQAASGTDADP